MAIGGHQSASMGNDEWLTPPEILNQLGRFDLDPCSPVTRPWDTAREHFSIQDDGLSKQWHGRVWLNPPYGRETGAWLKRLAEHGRGTALIFARTETQFFFDHVWGSASALLFIRGRLHFHRVNGERARANSGAPSVLVAYGEMDAYLLGVSGIGGRFILNCSHCEDKFIPEKFRILAAKEGE